MALAGAGLTVGEDCCVVAGEKSVDDGKNLLKELLLCCVWAQNLIEDTAVASGFRFVEGEGDVWFVRKWRANADDDADSIFFGDDLRARRLRDFLGGNSSRGWINFLF